MQTTVDLSERKTNFRKFTPTFFLTTTFLFFAQNLAFSSDITVPTGLSNVESELADKKPQQYRIFLGRFENEVPIEQVEIFANLGNVKSIKAFDGSYSFYSKSFVSEDECKLAMKEYKDHGLETLVKVIEIDGELYCPKALKKQKRF